MHDAYVADFGDYPKLAILCDFAAGRRLGVVWWACAGAAAGSDGNHREYLNHPEKWRHFAPAVFDALVRINADPHRTIASLEQPGVLPDGTVFFSEPLVCDRTVPKHERISVRADWLVRAASAVEACDIVFLDPDNGFAAPGFDPEGTAAGKSVAMYDLLAFLGHYRSPRRTLVVYHHQTRRKGGHLAELRAIAAELADADVGARLTGVLRATPWSPRAFFIINGDDEIANRAKVTAKRGCPHITWYDAAELTTAPTQADAGLVTLRGSGTESGSQTKEPVITARRRVMEENRNLD